MSASFRLYHGVRYAGSITTPFSFVPCQPWDADASGFARPAINPDQKWIKPALPMGAKATAATAEEVAELWHEVVRQVTDVAGLALGVQLRVPPQRRAHAEQQETTSRGC